MRRTQFNRWSLWAGLVGSLLVIALAAVQVIETAELGARRVGLDIEEEFSEISVIGVVPQGPAERAGVEIGDLLLSVAGVRLETIEDFDLAARNFERGEAIPLALERDGQQLQLQLIPGMPCAWARTTGRITVGLISLLIGVVALAGRSSDVRARLLAALFFLIATEFTWPDGLTLDSFWWTLGPLFFYVGTGAQLAIELHLASVLPRPEVWPKRRRVFIICAYSTGILIAVIGTATYLIEAARPYLLPWSVYQFDELLHQIVLPLWAVGMLALLAYATARAPRRQGRLRAALVLMGVLPWAVYILAGWWLGYPDRSSLEGWAALMPVLVLCYPVSVFVAIFRYQLFDLEFVVRRGLVYSTLTSILVAMFYAALGAGGAIFARFAGDGARSIGSLAAATLLLGLLFAPLRRAVQLLIDRRFFPEREAMRRRLIDLAAELPARGDAAPMGEHLVQELCAIFRISSATLLLAKPDGESLVRLAWSGPLCVRDTAPASASADDPWIAALFRAARPTSVETLEGETLEPDLARWAHAPAMLVPLLIGKRLVAVLILGEKHKGMNYSKEEVELLGLLAHHCAIAFDNARLLHTATYEGLTGLLRREVVLDGLAREISRARRYGRPLTVAMADIDHFKQINDRFGHLEGDRVLRTVAQEISARVRGSDSVGRYGGEEFLLVFPETAVAAGSTLAEQLRAAVEDLRLRDDQGNAIDVRLSIGVAQLCVQASEDERSITELLAAADRCLYRAKESGRNRVETASVEAILGRRSAIGRPAAPADRPVPRSAGESLRTETPAPSVNRPRCVPLAE